MEHLMEKRTQEHLKRHADELWVIEYRMSDQEEEEEIQFLIDSHDEVQTREDALEYMSDYAPQYVYDVENGAFGLMGTDFPVDDGAALFPTQQEAYVFCLLFGDNKRGEMRTIRAR